MIALLLLQIACAWAFLGVRFSPARTAWNLPRALARPHRLQLANTANAAHDLGMGQAFIAGGSDHSNVRSYPRRFREIDQALHLFDKAACLAEVKEAKSSGNMTALVLKMKHLASQCKKVDYALLPELLEVVDGVSERIPVELLTDWLWSLGRLGVKSSELGRGDVVTECLQRLCAARVSPSFPQISALFLALRTMRVWFCSIPPENQLVLCNWLNKYIGTMQFHELACVLENFGLIGGELWRPFADRLRPSVWDVLLKFSDKINTLSDSLSASKIILALGRIKVQISNLNEQQEMAVRQLAMHALTSNQTAAYNKPRSIQVSVAHPTLALLNVCQQNVNVVSGFHLMEARRLLPPNLTAEIHSGLASTLTDMNDGDFSVAVRALGGLWRWGDLSPALQVALQDTLLSQLPTMNSKCLPATLRGLTGFHCSWMQFNSQVLSALLASMASLLAQPSGDPLNKLTTVASALDNMEFTWTDLTESFQSSMLDIFQSRKESIDLQQLGTFLSR